MSPEQSHPKAHWARGRYLEDLWIDRAREWERKMIELDAGRQRQLKIMLRHIFDHLESNEPEDVSFRSLPTSSVDN